MTPEAHAAFTAALLKRLEADPDVLGLVLLGSTSGQPPLPDAFSDHDLFVVTRTGAQERFRNDLGWLPNAADLVLSFRETAHGVRALDRSGHLVEFAAFDLDELSLARVNRYSVPLDRADVRARMERVQQATAAQTATPPDPRWLAGQFLIELVLGAGRYGRGERLSGHFRVRVSAVQHLLALVRLRASPETRARLDDLDVSRRVESALPEVAREIDQALLRPIPDAARVAARHRPARLPGPHPSRGPGRAGAGPGAGGGGGPDRAMSPDSAPSACRAPPAARAPAAPAPLRRLPRGAHLVRRLVPAPRGRALGVPPSGRRLGPGPPPVLARRGPRAPRPAPPARTRGGRLRDGRPAAGRAGCRPGRTLHRRVLRRPRGTQTGHRRGGGTTDLRAVAGPVGDLRGAGQRAGDRVLAPRRGALHRGSVRGARRARRSGAAIHQRAASAASHASSSETSRPRGGARPPRARAREGPLELGMTPVEKRSRRVQSLASSRP